MHWGHQEGTNVRASPFQAREIQKMLLILKSKTPLKKGEGRKEKGEGKGKERKGEERRKKTKIIFQAGLERQITNHSGPWPLEEHCRQLIKYQSSCPSLWRPLVKMGSSMQLPVTAGRRLLLRISPPWQHLREPGKYLPSLGAPQLTSLRLPDHGFPGEIGPPQFTSTSRCLKLGSEIRDTLLLSLFLLPQLVNMESG